MPCAILQVGAEFSVVKGWPPDGFDPGEPCELELGHVEVLGALVGPDRIEACPCELAEIQKALNADPEALARVEAMLDS